MAAEVLAEAGLAVQVYDAMPSAARKFLLAGKSGMNLTHAEPLTQLLQRYQGGGELLQAAIRDFDNQAIRQWCEALGIACFVGSSGRVFPVDMKAAPLLRAWVHRLRSQGVAVKSLFLDATIDTLVRRFSETRRALGIGASQYDFGKSMLVCRMRHELPHHGVA